MDAIEIFLLVLVLCVLLGFMGLGYFVAHKRYQKLFGELKDLEQQHINWRDKLTALQNELWDLTTQAEKRREEAKLSIAKYTANKHKADEASSKLINTIAQQKQLLSNLKKQTADLQLMQSQRDNIEAQYATLGDKKAELEQLSSQIQQLKSELSLYSDMDEYVEYGIYLLPKYGEASSGAYNEKLKQIRAEQKAMVKQATAYTVPKNIEITGFEGHDKKLATNQGRLLITAFNSECDFLISKVNSKNYEATMTKIEKLAEQLEKRLLSLEIGIALDYVELKMQECTAYYQYICQKEAEAEEQRQIRAQIREEAAVQREIERAIAEAEKEEQMLQQAMQIARKQLEEASAEQRQEYETQLKELAEKLAKAESKEARALSMAQQTKQGHVYVISNIGSFGEDIYKIGMTRRLEPLDRVRELGDASVPFAFDVHAMIFSDNAPALEKQLHDYFADASLNKVNNRKEFFELTLKEIRNYIESQGIEAHWTMTAEATEYRQSLIIAESQLVT